MLLPHLSTIRCLPHTLSASAYISYSMRGISTSTRDRKLLDILLRNPELDETGAKDELRWIRDEIQSHSSSTNGRDIERLVERRGDGEPIQYILGNTDFGPLTLKCRPPTLIPRPETAFIFEKFISLLPHRSKPYRILDLCTGSAPIPLLLSHLLGDRADIILGVDIDERALELAEGNVRMYCDSRDRLGTEMQGASGLNVGGGIGDKIRLMRMDVFHPCFVEDIRKIGRVDIITSNPPYIPLSQWRKLSPSVGKYEDPKALIGTYPLPSSLDNEVKGRKELDIDNGLVFYKRIAEIAPVLLSNASEDGSGKRGPRVGLEIGIGQGEDVCRILREAGMQRPEIHQDQYGEERMVIAW